MSLLQLFMFTEQIDGGCMKKKKECHDAFILKLKPQLE